MPLRKADSLSLASVRKLTLGAIAAWLLLVVCVGSGISQRMVVARLAGLAASAEHEVSTTARVVDRLFTQMSSVANMVANKAEVMELAARYRTDPDGRSDLTRAQRADLFTQDPLVRKVGDFMNALSSDLRYARIYMNNLSDDTVTASNWADPDSIVGMIYTNRRYLNNALQHGTGHSFGIARLNRSPSYFVASRIEVNEVPQGSVTVKFDAPDMAHYLTGTHIALIVNRQGRVTTSSSDSFMLRNVAALLPAPPLPPEDGEDMGEAMDIRTYSDQGRADHWLIDGKPYLLRLQALNHAQYQLLTLASLDELTPMRQRHALMAVIVTLVGVALILLGGQALGQMTLRRQDERNAAMRTSTLNAELSAALADAQTKERQKTELLGYISHDLRAPLATIGGYASLLLSDAPESQHKLLQTIQRSVQYQLSLIDELMMHAKSELQPLSIQPVSTNLPRLLVDISEYAVALCAQQNNRFCHGAASRIPREIALDGKRVHQALLNLLSNAAKFTRNGVITLSVTAEQQDAHCALRFTVSDTGIGMDLPPSADIFDALQRVQAENGGAGLGLLITQRIVSAMGGSLHVSSTIGQGSTFSFVLCAPIIGTAEADWPAAAATITAAQDYPDAGPTVAMPSKHALDQLASLALNGCVTDIEGWIARHTNEAVYEPFLAQVQDLLDRFDFPGIRTLALHDGRHS